MSEISERLEKLVTPESPGDAVRRMKESKEVPGWQEYNRYSHARMQSLIREAKFFFNGTTWLSGMEAVEKTTDYLQHKLLREMVKLFAMGLLVGTEHRGEKDYTELFNSSKFDFKRSIRALEISMDKDTLGVISQLFAGIFAGTLMAANFKEMPQSELGHVWDVWYHSMGNTCQSLYLAGYQLADQMREEEILRGIELATRSEA